MLGWLVPGLSPRSTPCEAQRRRLLMIYDLATQPFSIGDILLFQEAALILRQRHALGEIDFSLVFEREAPACTDPAFAAITPQNVHYHLASILPAAHCNAHLGSLLLFNSHAQLWRFVLQSADRYLVWPPAATLLRGNYLNYQIYDELIYPHFREQGALPKLSCRGVMSHWARAFYSAHVTPDVPVTVHIRNNLLFGRQRNSNLDCWLELFRSCAGRYPARFVVICARHEVDPRWRKCPNVIVAKDHLTDLEQDLALIQEAAFHMGPASGPCTMAVFGAKPYFITNSDLRMDRRESMVREAGAMRMPFASALQRFTVESETVEMLTGEFARMWESVASAPGAARPLP